MIRRAKLAILILKEILKRNILWTAIGISLAVVLIILQLKFNFFTRQNVLRIGIVGTYQEHDLPYDVTRLLSSGLVEAGEDGRIAPFLVSGWEVNNDATQFKFKLKEGLYWSDGSPIKASDFDPAIPNTERSYPNEQTLEFSLKQPYSPLPSLLLKPVFKKGTLTGTGPYKIAKIEKSRIFITKIILEPVSSKLPKLYIRFYPSEKVAATGFNLGEVQVLLGASSPRVFAQNPRIGFFQKVDYSKIVTVLFSTVDPLLGNRSLRQALSYQATPVDNEEQANNPYPPNFWARDINAKKFLANPEAAQEALKRAKAAIAEDKLKSELILTTTPNLEEVGKSLVESWKGLGIDVKLRVESGIPQNFQALLITQSIPADPDQYFLWHATQSKTNLSKYDSKRVDKDLEDGRKKNSEDERKEIYFDFQRTLLEDAPAMFLYFPKYNIVYLKKSEPLLDKILR